jgi:hypothetical protein
MPDSCRNGSGDKKTLLGLRQRGGHGEPVDMLLISPAKYVKPPRRGKLRVIGYISVCEALIDVVPGSERYSGSLVCPL